MLSSQLRHILPLGRSLSLSSRSCFSTSSTRRANRAIIYNKTGDPQTTLSVITYPSLPSPEPSHVNVRFLLAPVNPADVNVIEGVYPSKPISIGSFFAGHQLPEKIFVAGNEGVAVVTEVGNEVRDLVPGDRVVMVGQQLGTWSSARTLPVHKVIKVPEDATDTVAATITVNPATAYNLLHQFVELKKGDWIIQNGANSAVGRAVIQIAARRGWKTLNFVRNRPNLESLQEDLISLGATEIHTYDDLEDKELRRKIGHWTREADIKLMLNCIGGPTTGVLARFLGNNAQLISYGAMSKQSLYVPTGPLIFKDLLCRGFWQSRWYQQQTQLERDRMLRSLIRMQLTEPPYKIITIPAHDSDETATAKVRDVMKRIEEGSLNGKALLHIEQPTD